MADHPVDSVMFDFGVNEHRTAFIAAWNAGYEACWTEQEEADRMDSTEQDAVRVEWYAPQRPVNGTVFVRTDESVSNGREPNEDQADLVGHERAGDGDHRTGPGHGDVAEP